MQEKPLQYLLTSQWGLNAASIWQTITVIFGLIFTDLSEVLTFQFTAIFSFFGTYWLGHSFLNWQYENGEKFKQKDWDFSVALVWWVSIGLTVIFIGLFILSFFSNPGTEGSIFFYSISIVPFGAAVSAAKKWELREEFA